MAPTNPEAGPTSATDTDPTVTSGRHAQIVAAAADVFDSAGYHLATMRSIADAADLSKATLYHYFPSKEALLYAIHDEFIELLIGREERRQSSLMPVEQRLREVMVDVLDLIDNRPGYVRVFFENHRELAGEYRQTMTEKRDRYMRMVEALIDRGISEERFRATDARLATLALFGMCNWSYQWFQRSGVLRSREVASNFAEVFLYGLARDREAVLPLGGPR